MEHQSIYRSNPSKPAPERSRSYQNDYSGHSSKGISSRSGRYYDDEELARSSRSGRHFNDEEFETSGYYSSSRSSYASRNNYRSERGRSDSRKNNPRSFEDVNHAKSKYVPKNKPIVKDSRSDGRKRRRIISYVYILIAAGVLVASVPINKSLFDKVIESGKDVEVIPDFVLNIIPINKLM